MSFGDKRLKNRAQKVLANLSRNATDSIPTACGGAGETKAAYRFFDNDELVQDKYTKHITKATLARMQAPSFILIPQDTTVLNFSSQHERKDAGPTTKDSTKGRYLHCAIAITPEKICLGAVSSKQWHREELQKLTRTQEKKL